MLNHEWILTAAHCVNPLEAPRKPEDLQIGYGHNDLVEIYDWNQYAEVEEYHVHPDYNSFDLKNDIALIKIKGKLFFSETVRPACLPNQHQDLYDGFFFFKCFISPLVWLDLSPCAGRYKIKIKYQNMNKHNRSG